MQFFLQGEQEIGKSHLIRELLEPYRGQLAGFYVQRICQRGTVVGFRAVNIRRGAWELEETGGEPAVLGEDGVFLLNGERDSAVLERIIQETEQDCQDLETKWILLDEIGGMELCSSVFMESLERILSQGKPCVGVFKSTSNLTGMVRRQGLGEAYLPLHEALSKRLRQSGQLVTMTEENRMDCRQQLETFLKMAKRYAQWTPRAKVTIERERIFLGPGIRELLNGIEKTGSVRTACEQMQLSYSKAWKMLNNLEEQARVQVVIRRQGGKRGGDTVLTKEGKELLERFESFERECQQAVKQIFEKYF